MEEGFVANIEILDCSSTSHKRSKFNSKCGPTLSPSCPL